MGSRPRLHGGQALRGNNGGGGIGFPHPRGHGKGMGGSLTAPMWEPPDKL